MTETLTDRIRRVAVQSDPGAVAAAAVAKRSAAKKIDEREQAIIDSRIAKAPGVSFLQKAAKGMAEIEIDARRQQRDYAEQAPAELTAPAREMVANLGDRAKVLDMYRKLSPEQRQEALKLAPGIAQQLGDDRGGAVGRALGSISRGVSHGVSQPLMELTGLFGTAEEIEYIRQLDAAASQEFNPARPGDPWYERGPLQAAEMAPWMATVVGGGGLGRAVATGAAKPIAAQMATRAGMGATTLKVAGRAGELAGITAAAFPGQYAQEVDQLKAIGMEDDAKLRLLAGGTAAVVGLIEGLVPNPIKAGPVSLTQGAAKAARQYLWEAAKRAPAEMSEEYFQGVTSGLGQHVAQYIASEKEMDFNGDGNPVKYNPVERKSIADAFALGWEQTKEAALPMAFLLGAPAAYGAGRAALQASSYRELQSPDRQLAPSQPPTPVETSASLQSELDALTGKASGSKDRNLPDGTVVPGKYSQLLTVDEQERYKLLPGLINEARKREETTPVELDANGQPLVDMGPAYAGPLDANGLPVQQTPEQQQKAAIAQSMAALDKPPGAHKWAEIVLGDRTRYKEAPDEATRTKEWQKSRSTATQGGTVPPALPGQPSTPTPSPPLPTPPAEQVPFVSREGIQRAMQSDPIGAGGNARAYAVSDDAVVRVPHEIASELEIKYDFKPVDHPLTKAGISAGQPFAENSQGVGVLYRQKGIEAGLSRPTKGKDTQATNDAKFAESIKATASLPQSAYDEFASTIKKMEAAGYTIDPSKSSNFLIDVENGRINIVDPIPVGKGGAGLNDMVVPLIGNTYMHNYKGEPLTPAMASIFSKAEQAAKNAGLNTTLSSGGEWSKELAGLNKKPVAPQQQTKETRDELIAKRDALQAEAKNELSIDRAFDLEDQVAALNKQINATPAETIVGTNSRGEQVVEDAFGVRSVISNGVRITEPVEIRPERGPDGSVIYRPKPSAKRDSQFETAPTEWNGVQRGGKVWLSGTGLPEPPAGYKPLAEFTPVITQTLSPDDELREALLLSAEENLREMKKLNLKDGDAVGFRVYPNPKSLKGGYWQYGTVSGPPAGSHAAIQLADGTKEMVAGSRLHKLETTGSEKPSENSENDTARSGKSSELDSKPGSQPEGVASDAPDSSGADLPATKDDQAESDDPARKFGSPFSMPMTGDPFEDRVWRVARKDGDETAENGLFYAEKEEDAGRYSRKAGINVIHGDIVRLENPIVGYTKEDVLEELGIESSSLDEPSDDQDVDYYIDIAIRDEAMASGYDGAIYLSSMWGNGEVHVFEPSRELTEADKPAETTPAVDEFTAAVNDAFDERFGDGKATEKAKPTKPPKKLQGKKDQQAPPKKTLSEKAKERKERTSAVKAEKLEKFKELLKKKNILKAAYDPKAEGKADAELLIATVELTAAAIDDGVSTFAEYVAWIAESIGASATRNIAPYLEAGWARLGTYDRFRGKIDKAGKVDDVLGEAEPVKEEAAYPDDSAYKAWMNRRHRIGDTPTSFLTGHSSAPVRDAARTNPGLGLVITPNTKQYIGHAGDYSHVMVDNGAFSEFTGSAKFDPDKFFAMLDSIVEAGVAAKVQFVVVPDKVGDWGGTNERWKEFYARVKSYGMPLAYVGQDGIEQNMDTIPWDQFDVFFIGGSTPWKLGYDPSGEYKNFQRPTDEELQRAGTLPALTELLREVKRRGKKIHMGRVNSWKRMEIANYGIQVDSVDGNYIGAAPNINLENVLGWLEKTGGEMFETETPVSANEYGTLEAPNRVELGKHFQQQLESGKDYKSIVEARKEAATLIAGEDANIEPGTPAAKAIDEAVEQGVVRAARSLAESSSDPLKVYDSLLDLYERQPRLNVRTGTSMRQQAYSTPAPAAWIANILSDTSRDNTAYDSSAGNGMLLLGVDPENAIANELNPDRAQALRELGYQVHEGDATEYAPDQQPDRIIINPPFGEDVEGKTWSIGGTTTDKIDHAIVLKTLESLPEDGKAVLIIGSKGFEHRQPKDELRRGEAYKSDKNFYNALYDGYVVTDHFTLHGDLYSKQGAAFPIDVIVIDGRGQSELPKPYQIDRQNAIPRVINSWQELRDVAERYLDTGSGRPSDLSTEPVEDDMGDLSSLLEGQGKGTGKGGRGSGKNTGGSDSIPPRGDAGNQQPRGDSGQPPVSGGSDEQGQSDSESVPDGGKPDGSGRRSNNTKRLDRPSPDVVEGDAETEFQVAYKKRSGTDGVGTLVPRTQARAVEEALEKAENRYGNLDEFVAGELGYSRKELGKYFSAEQVDALALAIARHKEGKAFVLGDQTGVGKGRVAAGMMVYAKRQGLVPVFMTQSPDLYADMYRDLQDIGQHSANEPFYALATNTLVGEKGTIQLPGGMELSQTADFAKNTLNAMADSVVSGGGPIVMITVEKTTDENGKPLGTTPSGKERVRKAQEKRDYDAVFTTYSQMQTVAGSLKDRHTALSRMAPNTFFVLDESHNAGGGSGSDQESQNSGTTRADLIRGLLNESKGVLFLSATYAKRADVMDLYAKTGMGDSIEGREEGLIDTIQQGGLPLQQVLSEMLVEAGAYMRRERSFEGIDFDAKVEETGIEEAGQIANIFGAIDRLDRIKNDIIKSKGFRRWLISQGMGLGTDSATGRRGMESSTFSSIVHNLVNQMLLSIKADATANAAIESLKRGEAPVIALSNTMGSALDQFLETNPANIGDEIDFRFSRAAERYLERSREIMLTDVSPSGSRTSRQVRLPDDVLGEDGIAAYNEARMLIDEFAAEIPASPIDWIRHRIEEAGYSVREVTGRDMAIDYSEGKIRLSQRPRDEIGSAGKLATVKAFNSGKLDVMILNQSGSTGLSAHASKLNPLAGQKRRHMIVSQADANIDTFMQMLGRINRTGQVGEKVVPTDPMSSRDDMMAELHQDQMGGEYQRKPRGTVTNLPHYTLLMTNVPAETRPAAVLIKKLSSLNANVTADSKGSVSFDAPDILNKVGDRVVAEYIADNPALNHALGDIVEVNAEGSPRVVPDIARKVSGRMAMRPIPEQQAFWDAVTETYAEEIDQLNKLGKNPLAATRMDLGAQTLERVEIFAGDPDADSPFLQPAYADRARVKKQGEPMTPDEIKSEINKFYGLEPGQETGLVKAIRDWTQKQGELAENAISDKTEQQVARLVNQDAIDRVRSRASNIESAIRRRLNSMAPGMSVAVSEVQEGGGYTGSIAGVVIDVKAKSGREHLPSGWVATIALSSPDRILRVPFSRIEASSSQAGDVYVAPAFEVAGDRVYAEWEEIGDVYEERIIGTGNVLAAFDKLVSQGDRGNIIFFTNEDGVSQRGVLMPRSFSLDRWAEKRPVIFANPQQVLDFISIAPGHQANDPNFAIQFTFDSGVMLVRSPRSRQKSGRYTTNQNLIEASGTDFVSVGQVLQMQVRGKKQQLAVIAAAQKIGPLIAANFYQDAKNVAGIGTDRGDGTVTPSISRRQAQKNITRQSRTKGTMPGGAAVRTPGEGIAAADIQKTVSEMFDVAVRQGGINSKAAGIYKWMTRSNTAPPSPEVIRTKEEQYASLATLSHEVAHHIDETVKVVRGMPALVRTEVRTLDYEPVKARDFEGWAEFFRRYVTEPPIDVNGTMMPNTIIDAPLTTEWFEKTFLPAHPELAAKIGQFREYAQQWANQSVFARVGTMIADRKPHDLRFNERWKQKGKRWLNRAKTNFLDKFHTLKWIQDAAKSAGHKGIGIYDLTMAYFMSASSHASIAFEEGVRSLMTGKQIGNTRLWDLSRHLEGDGEYNEAIRYALARHTLFMDEVKPGYNTGVDVDDAQAWVDEAEALGKADRYEEFARELAQFNDDLIMMLVDAGALSGQEAKKILDYYRDATGQPYYFPLHRISDLDTSEFAGTGAGFVNLGSPIRGRSRSGSGRQIIDPLDATITRAIKFYSRAIQARQAHTLAATLDPRLGGVGGMGGLMDRVPAKRIVHHGTIEEILNTLVDSGTIDADMAKAMRIAARIRDPQNGLPSEKDLDWFANKHNIADWAADWADMEQAAESEPDALAVISLWRPDYTPSAQKRTVMIYDRNGDKLMYEMDDELYRVSTGMEDIQFKGFMNILREAARYFKSGAVGLSTGFGTANLLRDYWEFQGKANHVKGLKTLGKPWQMLGMYVAQKTRQSMAGRYIEGKLGVTPKPDNLLIRLYEESGGKLYSVVGRDAEGRSIYRRKKIGKSTMSKLGLSIARPKESADNLLGMLQEMIAISDAPPRLADAEAALAEHGFVIRNGSWFDTHTNQPVDSLPESARIAASVAMSEATINFKRIGALGQYVEAFLPFFNATLQATYRQYEQMKNLKELGKDTPEAQRALRTLVYISALASAGVLYWLMRHDDDDWRNQDAWLRDGYWTWGANGKTYFRIPKPRDFGVVTNVVENMLDAWFHDDARETSDILLREIGGRIPSGGGMARGAVETYIADYDYFRGRELEDESVEDLPKPYRTSSYTSRMSDYLGKKFGRTLNTSPIQFQHLLNSSSGGMYGRLTDTYDAAMDGRLGPEHIPFWRGLALNRHQTRPIGEFYQKKAALDEQAETQKIEKDKVDPEVANELAYFGWVSEVMTALRKDEGKLGKKRTFANEPYITGLARSALGYQEQESNPNPLTAKDLPEDIRETIDEYRQLAVVGAAERLSPRSVFKSDEAHAKQAASIERAEAKFKSLNMTLDEAKQSLIQYWRKAYDKHPDPSKFRKLESLFKEE